MTRVGSSRAAARRSRSVVASARSPRSITRRVSASRDHPPQRRSMASAAVLTMSALAERIRAVRTRPCRRPRRPPRGQGQGQRARDHGCPDAPAAQRSSGCRRAQERGQCDGGQEGGLEAGESERPRGHGEPVADRDDKTLDRVLKAAGRVRREEMHEEAEIKAARYWRQGAGKPRAPAASSR